MSSQNFTYGVPSLSITQVVKTFMVVQGNEKMSHFVRYLTTAKLVFKNILKDTIWIIRQRELKVSDNGTVRLPDNMIRVLSFTVIDDCNNHRPLFNDRNMNTLQLRSHEKQCSCSGCSGTDDTLCGLLDTITVTESVQPVSVQLDMDDPAVTGDRKVRVYITKDCKGSIQEIKYIYGVVGSNEENDIIQTLTRTICDVEVNEKGCICKTESNMQIITEHIGHCIPCLRDKVCANPLPGFTNEDGYWKTDSCDKSLVHIKGDIKSVIITYQANGDDMDGEYEIPEYALDCFLAGMNYYTKVYGRVGSVADNRMAERMWDGEKRSLYWLMNPISMEEFLGLSSILPIWG